MTVRDNVQRSLQALISLEGSKAAFARRIGVSRAAVTNWTSGLNSPDIETIAKIAGIYSVPLSDILEGKLESPLPDSGAIEMYYSDDHRDIATGIRITKARHRLGYSKEQMTELLGISLDLYQDLEYGKMLYSDTLIKLCAILECSPNWLLGVKDSGKDLPPDSKLMQQLRDAFNELSTEGQREALKRVRELSRLPEYSAEKKARDGPADTVQAEAMREAV